MDIGTGIAIAGIWLFAGMAAMSETVSGLGMLIAIVAAGAATVFLGM